MRPDRSRLGWLAVGHAVLIGLFLALLNIPESNVLMLALSGLMLVLMLVWTAIVESRVVRWNAASHGASILRGTTGVPALVLALVVFAVFWWLSGIVSAWHVAHFGEVDAWLIARAGTTDAAWLHRAIAAFGFALRWIIGVSLAVALFATGARDGLRRVIGFDWLKRGLSLPLLAIVAITAVAGWQLVPRAIDWRPQGLPANAAQIAFALLKGLVLYLLLNAGWLAILAVASRQSAPVRSRSVDPGPKGVSAEQEPSPTKDPGPSITDSM